MRAVDSTAGRHRWRPSPFDVFVLAGAAVNLLVIAVLLGHWLISP